MAGLIHLGESGLDLKARQAGSVVDCTQLL